MIIAMIPKQFKTYLTVFIILIFSGLMHAQIDSKKKSVAIPAVENENDTLDASPLTPSKPIDSDNSSGLNTPKAAQKLKIPKKEFSMFGEKFGNPGELYTDRLKKHESNIKQGEGLGTKGSKIDVFFGNHRTKSKFVRVLYRDYGLEDGDLVRVSVNDEVISYRVVLTNAFKGFKIELKEGINTIEFLALNEGYALPNTAHFRIVDENDKIIAADLWALSVNVKGSVNIIKDP
ncbi:hypothetical protein [Seonamhaeicola sp.]|uniref:hypothetical protein n=1 Tax=Seonamhaeicola sp. TaxID=1912245 RepID=UPI00261EDB72|nr:hypothetical protein [Seonamhaeicola sp.]